MRHRLRLWLRVLTRAEALESDLDEELRGHLDRATERFIARGLSPRDARRAARRELGNIDHIRDEARAARRRRSAMEQLLTGLRQTVRRLAHEWRFSAAIVLVLAIGVGPTAAIGTVIYQILLRPLDYREPERLGLVRIDLGQLRDHPGLAFSEVLDLRRAGIFEQVEAEARLDEVSLGLAPDLVPLTRLGMSPGMLAMLGVTPILGRGFLDEDVPPPSAASPGAAPPPRRVLLDYATWHTHFGGERDVVGRVIHLNGDAAEIIGVLPDGFRLVTGRAAPQRVDVYAPLRVFEHRNFWGWPTLARLGPGTTFAEAESRLGTLAAALRQDHPQVYQSGLRLTVTPLLDDMTRAAAPAMRAAAAAVLLLFIIAFANATALVVARLRTRDGDMAVRSALGARTGALVREVLLESVVLATAGALVGALLAMLATAGIREIIPRTVPRWEQIVVGWEQLVLATALSAVGLLLLGLIPAWKVARGPSVLILRSGAVQGGKATGTRSRLVLVGAQMMFTVVLAFGCVQLARSAAALRQVDLGFDPNVLTLQVPYDDDRYDGDGARAVLYQRIRDRIRELPGVAAVGVVTHAPLSGSTMMDGYERDLSREPSFEQSANYQAVTPGYFDAVRIPILQGRDFTDDEDANERPVAIVDEMLVRMTFPGEQNVIGRMLRLGWGLGNAEIVGVVGHARSIEVSRPVRPQIYVPIGNLFQQAGIVVVRGHNDPRLLAGTIMAAIDEVGPGRAVSKVGMLSDNVAAATSTLRAVTGLVAVLTLSAGLLSGVGLYLVVAYLVHQHRRATAIRAALGATPRRLLWDHFRASAIIACVALPAGALLAIAVAPFLDALVFRVSSRDLVSLAGALAVAAVAGLLGTYLPARRATRMSILGSLREI